MFGNSKPSKLWVNSSELIGNFAVLGVWVLF